MSSLAGSFPVDEPGLPRGRGRRDAAEIQAAQRSRVLRATIAAVAEHGIAQVTIADIVRRARVSRAAFYALFATKEECFVAAVVNGRDVLLRRMAQAIGEEHQDPVATATRAVRTYLETSAAEPEFTYAWTIELPHAGPAARELRNAYFDHLAALLEEQHRALGAPGRPLTTDHYLTVVGGCHELFYRYVADGKATRLVELAPRLTRLVTDLLAG